MSMGRTAVVAVLSLSLLGLISIVERPGNQPEAVESVTRIQLSYRERAQCRAVWPAQHWPQDSVCSADEPYVSPQISRVQASPGLPVSTHYDPPPRTPQPLGTEEHLRLKVGEGATVLTLRQGRPRLTPIYGP